MSTTTPNMGLTKPDPDGSSGTWDTELNASLDVADAHDHTSGKGVKVPVAGLNINADLPFGGFGLTGLKVLDFAAVAAAGVAGYNTALFVSSFDNELYWRTSAGVDVKLTSGNSLNAALLGGFTGADYGVGGAEASYNGTTKIYNFLQAAAHRAKIDTSDHRLFEATAGVVNSVKLRSPAALAASYDWIFPTALPGSQQLLQITSGGQVNSSNTIPGAVSMSSTLGVTGLITASAGLTAGNNQHVTVQGTGLYRRGARVRHIPAAAGNASAGTFDIQGEWIPAAVGDALFIPIVVEDGERITAVSALLRADTTGSMTATLYRLRSTGDGNYTTASLGSATTATNNNIELVTVGGLTEVVGSTNRDAYVLKITSTTTKGLRCYLAQLTTDVP